jgi:(E)-4-hydroxy-3-methylbut-2-enyl-diphosphate synthase
MGCDIIRFSYPSVADHDAFHFLCTHSPMPVVADIHFDYRCALDAIPAVARRYGSIPKHRTAMDGGGSGTLGQDHGVAIRIGLNGGSLPRSGNSDEKQRMVDSALDYLSLFDSWGFRYGDLVEIQ